MKTGIQPILCACLLILGATVAAAAPEGKLSFPQTRAATYDEIRAHQAVGRAIAAPDGSFFLYEWLRPYNWAPDVEWLHPTAAKRMQAWMYKVDMRFGEEATSEYLFHPDPGSSYYLGSLSPDGKKVSFYELDHDENLLKAGVWDMALEQLTWFDAAPSSGRLEEGPRWATNEEIVYPTKQGWVRGKVPTEKRSLGPIVSPEEFDDTVETVACADCEELQDLGLAAGVYKGKDKAPIAAGSRARVLARSQSGDLSVYLRDLPEALTLMYQKDGRDIVTVFENSRVAQKVAGQ